MVYEQVDSLKRELEEQAEYFHTELHSLRNQLHSQNASMREPGCPRMMLPMDTMTSMTTIGSMGSQGSLAQLSSLGDQVSNLASMEHVAQLEDHLQRGLARLEDRLEEVTRLNLQPDVQLLHARDNVEERVAREHCGSASTVSLPDRFGGMIPRLTASAVPRQYPGIRLASICKSVPVTSTPHPTL